MHENALQLYRHTGRLDPELVASIPLPDLIVLRELLNEELVRIKTQLDEARVKARTTGDLCQQ
jgi:hypothetical protein